jgi:septum formation protein
MNKIFEYKIILASQSPERNRLLSELCSKYNLEFEVITSDVDEEIVKEKTTSIKDLVTELAMLKANDVFCKIEQNYEKLIVIGADTMAEFNGKFLGKPHTRENAIKMLEFINNNSHNVHTGMAIITKDESNICKNKYLTTSIITMKNNSHEDILEYVDSGEPLDKARWLRNKAKWNEVHCKLRRKR